MRRSGFARALASLVGFLGLAASPLVQGPAAVSGVVFSDGNGNGVRDAGEAGIAGVAVSNQEQVVRSGADGSYQLPKGGYGIVFVSVPDNYRAVGTFWRPTPDSGLPTPVTIDFGLRAQAAPAAFAFIHASDT